jgi:hypothetical protein
MSVARSASAGAASRGVMQRVSSRRVNRVANGAQLGGDHHRLTSGSLIFFPEIPSVMPLSLA